MTSLFLLDFSEELLRGSRFGRVQAYIHVASSCFVINLFCKKGDFGKFALVGSLDSRTVRVPNVFLTRAIETQIVYKQQLFFMSSVSPLFWKSTKYIIEKCVLHRCLLDYAIRQHIKGYSFILLIYTYIYLYIQIKQKR